MVRDTSIIKDKIKALERKLNLLYKKHTKIGLSEEESKQYREMQSNFYSLHNEYIDGEFERIFMIYLYDKDIIVSLNIIKSLLPWGGTFIFSIKEFEGILETFEGLTIDEIKLVSENLQNIHRRVFKNLEKFCEREELDEFILDIAEFVFKEKGAGLKALVIYMDERYREFAELVGIELDEVEVEWI